MQTIYATVASIEPHGLGKMKVIVPCDLVIIDPKEKLTVTPKIFDQEEQPGPFIDRIEFYGKGCRVRVGDAVTIEIAPPGQRGSMKKTL